MATAPKITPQMVNRAHALRLIADALENTPTAREHLLALIRDAREALSYEPQMRLQWRPAHQIARKRAQIDLDAALIVLAPEGDEIDGQEV